MLENPRQREHVLVIGADSFVGDALANAARAAGCKVTETTRRQQRLARDAGGKQRIFYDLVESDVGDLPKADAVFLCAATARVADCERDPDLARRINVAAAERVAKRYAGDATWLLFYSSDKVFDGHKPLRGHEEPTNPRSVYGRLKADAETAVLEAHPKAAILRLSKVVADDLPLFCQWAEDLKQRRAIRPFHDLFMAPVHVDEVAACSLTLMQAAAAGHFHLSGKADCSYEAAAKLLADRLGVSHELLQPISTAKALATAVPYCRHTSLQMDKEARAFGWQQHAYEAVLGAIFSRLAEKP